MTIDLFCRHLARLLLPLDPTARVAATAHELAGFFQVEPHEVGIFVVDSQQRTANFAWPPHTGRAINLPLKSFTTSLVSATARERRGLIDNAFATTPHLHMFEHGLVEREQRQTIQKVMSVPVSHNQALRWIVQVGRKGNTAAEAGPDFTAENLQQLERIAEAIAPLA